MTFQTAETVPAGVGALRPFAIGPHRIDTPVALAPMAGITDAPFRAQAASFGLDLTVSEMVSAAEYQRRNRAARAKARLGAAKGLISVQIAGRLPDEMAETARAAEAEGAAIIDVNMGCPATKVTSGGTGGSALMRDPDDALRILEAVRDAVSAPVTVKMRLGWDETLMTGVEIARRAAAAGLAMIVVHGRTRAQFYRGAADWAAIRPVVEAASAPVLANGDIVDLATARRALALSGANGVMIGRAAQACPWRPAEIAAGLSGRAFTPPSPAQAARLAAEHYEAALALYGREVGARAARKHLGWRLERLPEGAALRPQLLREDAPDRVLAALWALARQLDESGARWPLAGAGSAGDADETAGLGEIAA